MEEPNEFVTLFPLLRLPPYALVPDTPLDPVTVPLVYRSPVYLVSLMCRDPAVIQIQRQQHGTSYVWDLPSECSATGETPVSG